MCCGVETVDCFFELFYLLKLWKDIIGLQTYIYMIDIFLSAAHFWQQLYLLCIEVF